MKDLEPKCLKVKYKHPKVNDERLGAQTRPDLTRFHASDVMPDIIVRKSNTSTQRCEMKNLDPRLRRGRNPFSCKRMKKAPHHTR
jgi:hypothetical protein